MRSQSVEFYCFLPDSETLRLTPLKLIGHMLLTVDTVPSLQKIFASSSVALQETKDKPTENPKS
jgi:hypothetical protein